MLPEQPLTVGRLTVPLRARKGLLLTCAAVGLLVGLLAHALLPQSYAATSVVTVAPVTVNPFGATAGTQAVNMESERSAITSSSVVTRAANALGGDIDTETLTESLSVTVPSESLVLRVTSTDSDPTRAASWSNAIATAYLDDRTGAADEAAARIIARLQSDIDERVKARNSLSASDRAQADAELAALRDRVSALTTVGLNPGRLITPAVVPPRPTSLGRVALAGAGLAVGLLLGLGLALIRDRRSTTVDSASWLRAAAAFEVHEAGRAPQSAAARAAERAVTLRPRGGRRYAVLDLAGAGTLALVQALEIQLQDLGLLTHRVRAEPGHRLEEPTAADVVAILDLGLLPRPITAAALLDEGDVVLLQVDADSPRDLLASVQNTVIARGAEIGGSLFLRYPRRSAVRAPADGATPIEVSARPPVGDLGPGGAAPRREGDREEARR